MNQTNIINDLSVLTKVPAKALNTILEKEMLCIGSSINDAKLNGQSVVELNIGLGCLSVELATMQCKFIPSKLLKNTIKKSTVENIDPLSFEIEQALAAKLINISNEVL